VGNYWLATVALFGGSYARQVNDFDRFEELENMEESSGSISNFYSPDIKIKADDVAAVLAERGKRYGAFKGHAEITQGIKRLMHESGGWSALTYSQREALEMIAHTIGRMLNGDPTYLDNAVDIVGYAQLMLDDMTAADAIMRDMDMIAEDERKD
jgi:hypothetical protein